MPRRSLKLTICGCLRLTIRADEDQQADALASLASLVEDMRGSVADLPDSMQMGCDGQGAERNSKEKRRRSLYRVDLVGIDWRVTNQQWLDALDWLAPRVEQARRAGNDLAALRASLRD